MTPEILAEGIRLQSVLDALNSTKSYINTNTPDKGAEEILSHLKVAFGTLAYLDHEQTATAMKTLAESMATNTTGAIDSAIATVQSEFDNLSTQQP